MIARRLRGGPIPGFVVFVFAFAAAASFAAADREWPEYLGGPERNHYSPLRQIDRGNVARLRVAWEFHTGDPGQMECNPIVVGGALYGVTATSRIFSVDAATGRPLWSYRDPRVPVSFDNNRGVTYWSNGRDRRILATIGGWLYALDASTGRPMPGFGFEGRTSLKAGLGAQAQDKWVVSTTPGTLAADLLIVPTRVSEGTDAAPGYIQAFNVQTGTVAWVFHTLPYPGESGSDTWPKDAYRNRDVGSANCWAGMAIDRARGILYVPTGSAAPDFWGGQRLGDDLYANCLLALDAATGRLLWHFQFVHHDLWDRDLPAPPVLVALRHHGRRVDAVAQVTKSGLVFVFDRVSGQSLFPIAEVPVPPSPLAGESASPTQPWPARPAPFARQSLTEADLSPYAPDREALLARFRRARKGRFQPFGLDETLLFPGYDGGAEWGGPAVDPDGVLYVNANEMAYFGRLEEAPRELDLARLNPGQVLYARFCVTCHGPGLKGLPASGIPSLIGIGTRHTAEEVASLITTGRRMMPGFTLLTPADKASLVAFLFGTEKTPAAGAARAAGSDAGAGPGKGIAEEEALAPEAPYRFTGYDEFLDANGRAAISPPWGSLTAIDLNTGERRWRVALGEFKDLTAKGIPPTGTQNYGGPVATAGGLLFIAATRDGMIRAFDRATGKLLWKFELPAAAFATPATYQIRGRQYVVVACGGTKLETPKGDSYVAFALP